MLGLKWLEGLRHVCIIYVLYSELKREERIQVVAVVPHRSQGSNDTR